MSKEDPDPISHMLNICCNELLIKISNNEVR